jgi:hypothetical protein
MDIETYTAPVKPFSAATVTAKLLLAPPGVIEIEDGVTDSAKSGAGGGGDGFEPPELHPARDSISIQTTARAEKRSINILTNAQQNNTIMDLEKSRWINSLKMSQPSGRRQEADVVSETVAQKSYLSKTKRNARPVFARNPVNPSAQKIPANHSFQKRRKTSKVQINFHGSIK